jgi:hypothetical protein
MLCVVRLELDNRFWHILYKRKDSFILITCNIKYRSSDYMKTEQLSYSYIWDVLLDGSDARKT